MTFLVIAHSHRSDLIPHWLHSATVEALRKPCNYVNLHESHFCDVGRSRDQLARIALSSDRTTHVLFVDDDIIIPDSECLAHMLEFLEKNNASIVSGLYYKRYPPHEPLIMDMKVVDGQPYITFPFANKEIPKDTLIRVGCVPAGFLLVKREAFEKIGEPYFVYGAPELCKGLPLGEWTPGEDVYFSWKARKAGFELWVDTRADLLHYVPKLIGNPKLIEAVIGTGAAHTAKLTKKLEEHASGPEKEMSRE